jgi:hypothetical protein
MSNQPGRPREESRPEGLEPFFKGSQAVIVLMDPGETEDQAWRRYIKEHLGDIHTDVSFSPLLR